MKKLLLVIVAIVCTCNAVQAQNNVAEHLANVAQTLEDPSVVYDPSYVRLSYPNGDVPATQGVCTDVVIRAFRKAFGWDLQKSIYEFRKAKGQATDRNIDHRRVKSLRPYFDSLVAQGILVKVPKAGPYQKGNIIIWDLGAQEHIGICVDDDVIIHNICCGQVIEDMYMQDIVIRNYRFAPNITFEQIQKL